MESQITIRRAALSDLKTLQNLAHALLTFELNNFEPDLDPNWAFSDAAAEKFRRAISEKFVLLAFVDNNPIGYLIGSLSKLNPNAAHQSSSAQLENIFVNENFRQHKVGTKLWHEFHNFCQANHATKINVTVNAQNSSALDFYRKIGMSPSRIILSQNL